MYRKFQYHKKISKFFHTKNFTDYYKKRHSKKRSLLAYKIFFFCWIFEFFPKQNCYPFFIMSKPQLILHKKPLFHFSVHLWNLILLTEKNVLPEVVLWREVIELCWVVLSGVTIKIDFESHENCSRIHENPRYYQ